MSPQRSVTERHDSAIARNRTAVAASRAGWTACTTSSSRTSRIPSEWYRGSEDPELMSGSPSLRRFRSASSPTFSPRLPRSESASPTSNADLLPSSRPKPRPDPTPPSPSCRIASILSRCYSNPIPLQTPPHSSPRLTLVCQRAPPPTPVPDRPSRSASSDRCSLPSWIDGRQDTSSGELLASSSEPPKSKMTTGIAGTVVPRPALALRDRLSPRAGRPRRLSRAGPRQHSPGNWSINSSASLQASTRSSSAPTWRTSKRSDPVLKRPM